MTGNVEGRSPARYDSVFIPPSWEFHFSRSCGFRRRNALGLDRRDEVLAVGYLSLALATVGLDHCAKTSQTENDTRANVRYQVCKQPEPSIGQRNCETCVPSGNSVFSPAIISLSYPGRPRRTRQLAYGFLRREKLAEAFCHIRAYDSGIRMLLHVRHGSLHF